MDPQMEQAKNDATDINNELNAMGFISTLVTDCNKEQFEEAITDFVSSLEKGDFGLFYFAGGFAKEPSPVKVPVLRTAFLLCHRSWR